VKEDKDESLKYEKTKARLTTTHLREVLAQGWSTKEEQMLEAAEAQRPTPTAKTTRKRVRKTV
jgi:hypothetical protein